MKPDIPMRGEMTLTPESIAARAAQVAQDKRALDVTVLDVRDLTVMTDYFVIASADNVIQVRAICEGVIEHLAEHGITYKRREGWEDARWVLLDYGDVIVHTFLDSDRKYYDLERLWGDAPRLTLAQGSATLEPVESEA